MEIKRAIVILESGIKMPDIAHTSDELDTALKLACKCLELYSNGFNSSETVALKAEIKELRFKITSLESEIDNLESTLYQYQEIE